MIRRPSRDSATYCEDRLQKSLNEEKSERDADTEFEGKVKTKREGDAKKDTDDCEERPPLGGRAADDESGNPFNLPESDEASRGLLRTARKLLDKIKAKIPMISQSTTDRGKMIVETAVKNDKRPVPRRK